MKASARYVNLLPYLLNTEDWPGGGVRTPLACGQASSSPALGRCGKKNRMALEQIRMEGDHRNFEHAKGLRATVSGNLGDDAKLYQEREVGCLKTPLLGQICCPVFGPRKYRLYANSHRVWGQLERSKKWARRMGRFRRPKREVRKKIQESKQ